MSGEREAPQRRDTFGAAVNGSEQRLTAILAELRGLREDVSALSAAVISAAKAPPPPPAAPPLDSFTTSDAQTLEVIAEPKPEAVDVSLPGGEPETVPTSPVDDEPVDDEPVAPTPPARRPASKAAKRGRR